MPDEALDEFGRRLVREVRDETISDWEMILSGKMKGERAERIRLLISRYATAERGALMPIIPEIVDSVLHHLLRWLEEDDELQVSCAFGEEVIDNLAEESDGLPGELYSDAGWIARFSKFQ